MSTLKAGFSTVNIDPKLGVGIYGYYVPRFAKGILDSLEINALALRSGDTSVILSRRVRASWRKVSPRGC